jgi:hypothetical protein
MRFIEIANFGFEVSDFSGPSYRNDVGYYYNWTKYV